MLPLLLSALPGLFQIGSGLLQGSKASQLRPDYALPPGQAEELANHRQAAASQLMPGQVAAQQQIQQNASNAINNAIQGGNSSSNILATAAGVNRQADLANVNLATQGAQFQQQQQNQLNQSLLRKAHLEQQRRQEYNQAKSALTESSAKNVFGGLSGLASTAVYGSQTGAFGGNGAQTATAGAPATGASALSGADPMGVNPQLYNLPADGAPYGTGSVQPTPPVQGNNYGNYFQNLMTMPRNFGQYGYDPSVGF